MWLSFVCSAVAAAANPSFVIENDRFVQDGKPVQLISGSFHYSRCPAALWKDRLQRLRAMGLNTIQTYVPWNWHEEEEGNFTFTGDHDIVQFIKTAQEVGLLVLVRSGPYMCGEWEFGGLPAWLLSKDGLVIRTMNDAYISYVDKYFGQLLPKLEPLLYSNGGPVVMVQVENEFGSYGNVESNSADKQYLQHLISLANAHFKQSKSAEKVIIYTTDGGNTGYMTRGSLKGDAVFTTGDGGPSDGSGIFNAMKQFNPKGGSPGMNSEDYTGWLTHWGEHMANQSSAQFADNMGKLLRNSHGSLNMYMGFGGTNFGFMSGANGGGTRVSYHITSYDYASPLSEGGQHGWGTDHTDKYEAYRKAITNFTGETLPAEPPSPVVTAYGNITFSGSGSVAMMSEAASQVLVTSSTKGEKGLRPMEFYGQNYGFIRYTFEQPGFREVVSQLRREQKQKQQQQQQQEGADSDGTTTTATATATATATTANVTIQILDYARDRAQVFTGISGVAGSSNGAGLAQVATIFRNGHNYASIALPDAPSLSLLVENMGRINFGHSMTDHKGITQAVLLGGRNISGTGVTVDTIPLKYDQVKDLPFGGTAGAADAPGPRFYKASLQITGAPADTYLSTRNGQERLGGEAVGAWHKGYIWVNGHNLGRYWEEEGPQHALYVPACFLTTGANEVIALELEPPADTEGTSLVLQSTDRPDFSNQATPPSPAPGTPCAANPQAGHVLELQTCDSSKNQAQLFVYQPLGSGKVGGHITLLLPASHPNSNSNSNSNSSSHSRPLSVPEALSGKLCLSLGPGRDATFGFPLAQMEACDATEPRQIHDWVNDTAKGAEGLYTLQNIKYKDCFDVSNHKVTDGSPVGWYSCQAASLLNNEAFSRVETPLHGEHIIGKESGKCVTAC